MSHNGGKLSSFGGAIPVVLHASLFSSSFLSETGSHCVAQSDLELPILLPQLTYRVVGLQVCTNESGAFLSFRSFIEQIFFICVVGPRTGLASWNVAAIPMPNPAPSQGFTLHLASCPLQVRRSSAHWPPKPLVWVVPILSTHLHPYPLELWGLPLKGCCAHQ